MDVDANNVGLQAEALPENLLGHRPGSLNWKNVYKMLQSAEPGEWHRLVHNYQSANTARSAVARAARVYRFEYRVTVNSPQPNGLIGIFIRLPEE